MLAVAYDDASISALRVGWILDIAVAVTVEIAEVGAVGVGTGAVCDRTMGTLVAVVVVVTEGVGSSTLGPSYANDDDDDNDADAEEEAWWGVGGLPSVWWFMYVSAKSNGGCWCKVRLKVSSSSTST